MIKSVGELTEPWGTPALVLKDENGIEGRGWIVWCECECWCECLE